MEYSKPRAYGNEEGALGYCPDHAQNLTVAQVGSAGFHGSTFPGSANSPSWYLALMAALAARPTAMN